MRQAGHFFPDQRPTEKIVIFTRRHWISFLPYALSMVLMVGICVLLVWSLGRIFPDLLVDDNIRYLVLLGGVLAFLTLLFSFVGFLDYYLDVWMLTNERVVEIEQTSLFGREINELHLHNIQDVSSRVRGFLETFLDYGTILIQTAGETELFEFKYMPRPYEVEKVVLQLKRLESERYHSPGPLGRESAEEMDDQGHTSHHTT